MTTVGTAGAGAALRVRLLLTAPAVRATTAAVWRPPGLAARYATYLTAMHGVVRASVPLMERAVARLAEFGPRDPLCEPLTDYLREHIEEERGHDDWLLGDITALGGEPAAVLAEQPISAVARLAGAQYYWIEHHHPVALLGYIAVLESNAPAPWLADRIAAAGVPEAALRTVRGHAELDTGHTAALFALLDALPLDQAQVRAVVMSALHTVDGLVELFARIGRTAEPEHLREGTYTS
ncbi:iron-containing redox enzyme family protein [Streptomyces sp. NPDC008079]|uniref:iron-containing redox enzyme family protein n=1 Tax=Streptomyces sp. NPDC008079 TaxID=3364806 RepID=UPI0036E299EB